MSDNVKLPKNVASAVEWLRDHQGYTNYDILQKLIEREFTNGHHAECIRDFIVLDDGFDILLQALVNGYELEQTPEERIREIFKYSNLNHYYRSGVIRVLDIYNIKIEGVNT